VKAAIAERAHTMKYGRVLFGIVFLIILFGRADFREKEVKGDECLCVLAFDDMMMFCLQVMKCHE
jgi:hypothetical protein